MQHNKNTKKPEQIAKVSTSEKKIGDIIWNVMDLLQAFANLSGIDFITFYESIIREPELQTAMVRLQITPPNKAA